jgi:hypothetical protein
MIGEKKHVGKVLCMFQETRGVFAGPRPPSDDDVDPIEGLVELKIRNEEGYYDSTTLVTGPEEIIIRPEWNSNGRVFIRQVDPVPMTILSIQAEGQLSTGEGD